MMELSVEIPAETVRAEINKAYIALQKKAHLRGFRPGKAPRPVLERMFAPQVAGDVANNIVNETLPKALSEKSMTPISTPNVEPGAVDAAAAFAYKARFEVQPDVEEVKYEGFELSRPSTEVTDKAVEEELEGLRLAHSTLKAPEPARPARAKDTLTVDLVVSVDGKPVENGDIKGFQLEIGSGQILPELDAACTGKSPGDAFTVEAQFPEGHAIAQLRGKKGTLSVTLHEVKERVLPALDDELAKDVGGFQTLVELRADVHTKLERFLKERAETSLAEQIVEKLNESNPLEVPPSLVEQQCKLMEQELALQLRRAGQRVTQEQLKAAHGSLHADAEKKVRAGLLMAAIAKKLEMKITDDDIEKGLAELAESTGKNIAKVRAEYRDQNRRNLLVGMILEDKILDHIEGKSKVTDAPAAETKSET